MTLRSEKMAERRERILAAARALIAEEGFEALTTRSLAERARVTVPTIYNLVGAKDAVLLAAVEDQTARFLAALGPHSSLRPVESVIAVSRDCVDELARNPLYYRALLKLLQTSDAAREVRRSVGRSVVVEYERGLAALRETGELLEWLAPRSLAERLGAHLTAASMQWALGDLDDGGFRSTAVFGTCLILMGATRGAARDEAESAAKSHHSAGRARPESRQLPAAEEG